jgi:myo-inositol 2-dehydrogenase/D-chiro-inositol 1-dehydrogenase
MGRLHLNASAEVAEIEIVAICDPALRLGNTVALSVPVICIDEMVDTPEIQALLIAAPTPVHQALVERALACGKHVLCEKPLTLDPAADLALAEHAARTGQVLQVGFWRRFAKPFRLLRDVLQSGRIGAPAMIRCAQWDAAAPPPAFCDPSISGGIEIDCGVHEFDLVRWLLCERVEAVIACGIQSSAALKELGDVDTLCGLAQLSGGGVMAIDLTRQSGYRDSIRTEIIGAHGSAVAEFGLSGAVVVQWGDQREVISLESENVIADAVRNQLRAFAMAVRGFVDRDAAGPHDSRHALLAAQALRRSRETKIWSPVPQ